MPITNLIDKNELQSAITLVNQFNIPSPPKLVIDLKLELDKSSINLQNIIAIIKQDIGLSSSVLKLINSSLYSFNDEITSIEQAISLIGPKGISDFILPPAYKLAVSNSIKGFEAISEHSHLIGQVAEIIGKEIQTNLSGHFYLAGLFHDVGAIVLAFHDSNYFKLQAQYSLHPITWPLIEKDRYGITHSSISVLVAKKWGLPNDVCNAIFLHHQVYGVYLPEVSENSVTIAAVLKLANFLHKKILFGSNNEENDECTLMYRNALKELMIDEETLANIESEMTEL